MASVVGRARERAEVGELLLDQARLVTLVGAGGCGKTRLAREVAADIASRSGTGARWVELAGLEEPALVAGAVAAAVDARSRPGTEPVHTIIEQMEGTGLLLVLDNCEHLRGDRRRRVGAALRAPCTPGAPGRRARRRLHAAVADARRGRGERGRPETDWDALTPTERDLVRLVVEGHTNARIGERLFISPNTVKKHLSSVYAKVGAAGRAEPAAEAARRGAGACDSRRVPYRAEAGWGPDAGPGAVAGPGSAHGPGRARGPLAGWRAGAGGGGPAGAGDGGGVL